MKLLVQKSLKTVLQLKRYDVLKWQGLDCKFQGLDYKYVSKQRARIEFIETTRASVKNSMDYNRF
jgi:hypothetical protein